LNEWIVQPSGPSVRYQPLYSVRYQPLYFVADSMADAKQSMSHFCDTLQRPFHPQYC
jgi:hypothetical protein